MTAVKKTVKIVQVICRQTSSFARYRRHEVLRREPRFLSRQAQSIAVNYGQANRATRSRGKQAGRTALAPIPGPRLPTRFPR
jgi:hypothetical protein